jgi:beta-lactam-binding protein with PASTA domain
VGIQSAAPTYVPQAVPAVGSGDAPPRPPVKPGSVIAQTPGAGSRIFQNGQVTLTVAQ